MARQAFVAPDEADDDTLDFLASGRKPAPEPAVPRQASAAPAGRAHAPRAARVQRSTKRDAPRQAGAKATPASLKRVGLYLDTRTWAELKRVGLARADQGLPHDFTTIVLEALKALYPERKWGI